MLVENKGRPVNVYRALGIRSCGRAAWSCVIVHVRRFRRHGYVIRGAHDGTYTYAGMEWSESGRASVPAAGDAEPL